MEVSDVVVAGKLQVRKRRTEWRGSEVLSGYVCMQLVPAAMATAKSWTERM